MSWSFLDNSRDDSQYLSTLKNHNYLAWDIYYEHEIESLNNQIHALTQQIQQINTMSLTSTAVIAPYQRTSNSFQASNDFLSLVMAQKMSGIMRGYSNGIQKNSREIKKIQEKLKQAEDRKRGLIRLNRNVLQNKQQWEASQLSQQLNDANMQSRKLQNSQNAQNNNNNNNDDLQQNMQNMQNKMKEMEIMLANVQSHVIDNNQNQNDSAELRGWLEDVAKLPQYFSVFVKNGFEDIESLKDVTLADLTQIKITKLGHQKKLLKEIQKLND